MIARLSNAKSALFAVMACAVLAACASEREPAGQPSFYQSLAAPGAELDANAAQSMISGLPPQ